MDRQLSTRTRTRKNFADDVNAVVVGTGTRTRKNFAEEMNVVLKGTGAASTQDPEASLFPF